MSQISAKKTKITSPRICQGDIFTNIEIIESINFVKSEMEIKKICFPYSICLNQECDLESDFKSKSEKDSRLLHIAIAPVFLFEQFLAGNHWGTIFTNTNRSKRGDTKIDLIMKNEIPRFHYLRFIDDDMPEFIIDFKHFFTIEREYLYSNLDQLRLCSIDDLFKEKISQRFSNFISRIGLPV